MSPTIDAKLRADGYQITRYGGADRFATAMQIATHGLDNPASAIVVTGQDFPHGLATGDTFNADGKPAAIMLSSGDHITDQATAAFVRARQACTWSPARGQNRPTSSPSEARHSAP